jgi:capsular polysaccharide export protein
MVNALVYIDSHPKYRFFRRLEYALGASARFTYVTNYLAIYLRARARHPRCLLITPVSDASPQEFYKDCAQYLAGLLAPSESARLAGSALACFQDATARFGCDLAIIWNGARIAERALAEIATTMRMRKVFLEIGNFPGKLFVDGEGVNAQSSLARDPSILDRLPPPAPEYYRWKDALFDSRRNGASKVPQRARLKGLNSARLLDDLGWIFLPKDGLEQPQARLRRALASTRCNIDNQTPNGPFAFFPLQVSLDSQVLVNYRRTMYDAVCEALSLAKRAALNLVVKPHPAEPTIDPRISELAKADPALSMSAANTTLLLDRATTVITINSTVGLEAILLGKPVTVLGDAFYDGLHSSQLDRYVDSYLIDIDFFSSEPIETTEARRLIARATG